MKKYLINYLLVGLLLLFTSFAIYFKATSVVKSSQLETLNSLMDFKVKVFDLYVDSRIEYLKLISSRNQLRRKLRDSISGVNVFESNKRIQKILKAALVSVDDIKIIQIFNNVREHVLTFSKDDQLSSINIKPLKEFRLFEKNNELYMLFIDPLLFEGKQLGYMAMLIKATKIVKEIQDTYPLGSEVNLDLVYEKNTILPTPRSPKKLSGKNDFSVERNTSVAGLSIKLNVRDHFFTEKISILKNVSIVLLVLLILILFYQVQFFKNTSLDVSARRAYEDKLERKNQELTQFAYKTSHDLKVPLTNIMGMADLMVEDLDSSFEVSDLKTDLKVISDQSKRLSGIVDDILEFSKLDLQTDIQEDVSVKDVINTIQNEFSKVFKDSKIEFIDKISHENTLSSNRIALETIFRNLVSNSIKYSDTEKKDRFIEISSVQEADGVLLLRVRDNGVGIDKKHLARVFDLFSRVGSKDVYGTGLGLYLVKKLVVNLNGEISINSRVGEGTITTIKFVI